MCMCVCLCKHVSVCVLVLIKTIFPLFPTVKDLPTRIQLDLQSNDNRSPSKSWKVYFGVEEALLNSSFSCGTCISRMKPVQQYVIFHSTDSLLPMCLFNNLKPSQWKDDPSFITLRRVAKSHIKTCYNKAYGLACTLILWLEKGDF